MDIVSFMLISTNILIFFFTISSALHTITPSQSVSDGNTIVSTDESFELGFFSPGSSKNRYVGIWYKNIPVKTIVWVANRENPINDSSGLLMINSTGNLVLLGQNKSVVWSTNSMKEAQNPIVQLLDSGNLVLRDARDGNSDYYLWQSFDYPSDTLLSGMKLGRDLRTGLNRRLSSWKNLDDPSPGDFTWEFELSNNPERIMWKGSKKYYRSGPWNGISFSSQGLRPNPFFDYNFVSNEEEVYFIFHSKDKSIPSIIVMNQTNYLRQHLTWSEATQTWNELSYVPRDLCDPYAVCGTYGNCLTTAMPACQCLKGFTPKSPEKWSMTDWSEGCQRNKPLNCPNGDGFIKFSGLKLPETTHSWVNKTVNLKECKAKCLQDCSCMAYTNFDIRDGSGCAIWFGDLIDIRSYPAGGQDLYIRMSASEIGMGTV